MGYLDSIYQLETPLYVYNHELFEKSASALNRAAIQYNFKVHYAVKANHQAYFLEHFAKIGFGVECVSAGEIQKALAAGIHPNNIGFSGVGKSTADIRFAIEEEVGVFQVESLQELEVIQDLASAYNNSVKVALRLNPDILVDTHGNISTGSTKHKFGFTQLEYNLFLERFERFNNIRFIGLHFHIGSQIRDTKVFKSLAEKASLELNKLELHLGYPLNYLNLGGGYGIDYSVNEEIPDYSSWLNAINSGLSVGEHVQVIVEPGRSIMAHCGTLLSKVLYTKPNHDFDFVVVDASMNDMMRSALYRARHPIEIWPNNLARPLKTCQIVGGVCETTDKFGEYLLPQPTREDWIMIRNVVAYGESMWLDYNGRQRPGSIIVKKGVEDLLSKLQQEQAKAS